MVARNLPLAVLLVVGLGVVLGGCENMVTVTHGPLEAPAQRSELSIQTGDLASNARTELPQKIGAHLFTVFGIPVSDIAADRPITETMQAFVTESLETAGYRVIDVRGKQVSNQPILRGEINKFWFAGYSWLWPLYIQGGEIKYRLTLQEPGGTVLWEKDLKGTGAGAMVFADVGYPRMVESATTSLLNKIIAEVQSAEFKSALAQKIANR